MSAAFDTVPILGSWVFAPSEQKIILMDLESEGLPDHMHCIYNDPVYINILRDKKDILHLMLNNGSDFVYQSQEGEHLIFYSGFQKCIVLVEKPLFEEDAFAAINLVLHIRFTDNEDISGIFVRPHRLPDAEVEWGKQFNSYSSDIGSIICGRDITTLDPINTDSFSHHTKGIIFRLPPSKSPWLNVNAGAHSASPFGWWYFPNVNSYKSERTTLITNAQEYEKALGTGLSTKRSHEKSTTIDVGVNASYMGFDAGGSYKNSHTQGLSSDYNQNINRKTKNAYSKETLRSVDLETNSLLDFVVDRPNILFDGEKTKYDDATYRTSGTFYGDLLKLKTGTDADYQKFIQTYGTHYIQSVRKGSRILRLREFTQTATEAVVQHGISVNVVDGSTESKEEVYTSKVAYLKNSASLSVALKSNTEAADGKNHSNEESEKLNNLYKDEIVEEKIQGSLRAGDAAADGAFHCKLSLHPIHELLSPPFFNDDYEILTTVRTRLEENYFSYLHKQAQKLSPLNYTGNRVLEVEAELPATLSSYFDIPGEPHKPIAAIASAARFVFSIQISTKRNASDEFDLVYEKTFTAIIADNKATYRNDTDLADNIFRKILPLSAISALHIETEGSIQLADGTTLALQKIYSDAEMDMRLKNNITGKGITFDSGQLNAVRSSGKPLGIRMISDKLLKADAEQSRFNYPVGDLGIGIRSIGRLDFCLRYKVYIASVKKLKDYAELIYKSCGEILSIAEETQSFFKIIENPQIEIFKVDGDAKGTYHKLQEPLYYKAQVLNCFFNVIPEKITRLWIQHKVQNSGAQFYNGMFITSSEHAVIKENLIYFQKSIYYDNLRLRKLIACDHYITYLRDKPGPHEFKVNFWRYKSGKTYRLIKGPDGQDYQVTDGTRSDGPISPELKYLDEEFDVWTAQCKMEESLADLTKRMQAPMSDARMILDRINFFLNELK
jgi:hypothetical protein